VHVENRMVTSIQRSLVDRFWTSGCHSVQMTASEKKARLAASVTLPPETEGWRRQGRSSPPRAQRRSCVARRSRCAGGRGKGGGGSASQGTGHGRRRTGARAHGGAGAGAGLATRSRRAGGSRRAHLPSASPLLSVCAAEQHPQV